MSLGPIAQMEEPPAHNRKVPGSNPGGPTGMEEGGFHHYFCKKSLCRKRSKKSAPSGALFFFVQLWEKPLIPSSRTSWEIKKGKGRVAIEGRS